MYCFQTTISIHTNTHLCRYKYSSNPQLKLRVCVSCCVSLHLEQCRHQKSVAELKMWLFVCRIGRRVEREGTICPTWKQRAQYNRGEKQKQNRKLPQMNSNEITWTWASHLQRRYSRDTGEGMQPPPPTTTTTRPESLDKTSASVQPI